MTRLPAADPDVLHESALNVGADLTKVPAIILPIFWLIKIITTGLGEGASDLLVEHLGIGFAAALMGIVTIFALAVQIRGSRYHPQTYWFAVTMIAIFATVASDVFSPYSGGPLNVPIQAVIAGYAAALAISFVAWYLTEKTLSIHSITTMRREIFYWVTITLAFALGTAVGDWAAFTVNLGIVTPIYLAAGIVLLAGILWRLRILNGVLAFWIAYIATRPLGASISDKFAVPKPYGLGYSKDITVPVGLVLVALLVAYLWWSREDAEPEPKGSPLVSRGLRERLVATRDLGEPGGDGFERG